MTKGRGRTPIGQRMSIIMVAPQNCVGSVMSMKLPPAVSGLTEPVGNGYARVARINNVTTFGAAASGVKQNAIAITFPEATGSWGSVLHFSIWANETSETLANLIATGSLAVTKAVTAGDTPRFPINSLSITQD